jgi:hypothetical protein
MTVVNGRMLETPFQAFARRLARQAGRQAGWLAGRQAGWLAVVVRLLRRVPL